MIKQTTTRINSFKRVFHMSYLFNNMRNDTQLDLHPNRTDIHPSNWPSFHKHSETRELIFSFQLFWTSTTLGRNSSCLRGALLLYVRWSLLEGASHSLQQTRWEPLVAVYPTSKCRLSLNLTSPASARLLTEILDD